MSLNSFIYGQSTTDPKFYAIILIKLYKHPRKFLETFLVHSFFIYSKSVCTHAYDVLNQLHSLFVLLTPLKSQSDDSRFIRWVSNSKWQKLPSVALTINDSYLAGCKSGEGAPCSACFPWTSTSKTVLSSLYSLDIIIIYAFAYSKRFHLPLGNISF